MKKNYLIEYTAFSKDGSVLKSGKMRVKNKLSELGAKVNFEDYLKRKYRTFGSLIVHSCVEENPFNSMFGDIFK